MILTIDSIGTKDPAITAGSLVLTQTLIKYYQISILILIEEFRGNGLGSSFLEELVKSNSLNQGVIVEVEKPEHSRSDQERAVREKRIKFYQKAGFYLVPDIDYSIWDVPMHLMVLPLKASLATLNEMIGQIIYDIYLELMGKR